MLAGACRTPLSRPEASRKSLSAFPTRLALTTLDKANIGDFLEWRPDRRTQGAQDLRLERAMKIPPAFIIEELKREQEKRQREQDDARALTLPAPPENRDDVLQTR